MADPDRMTPPLPHASQSPAVPSRLGRLTPAGLSVWSDRSTIAFLGLGFLAPSEPAWALWFYVLVMPFGAWAVFQGWRPDWKDGRLMLLLGLVVWSTLTIAWADETRLPLSRQALWVFNGLCTATYLLALTTLAERSADVRYRLTLVIVCCATGNALFSVVRFLTRTGGWDRLTGWGETRNAILGAFIIGLCSVLALGRSLAATRFRALWLLPVPLFLAFIALTGSRGPLITVVLAALIFLPRWPRRAYLLAGTAILAAAMAVALLAPEWPAALYDRLAQRGTSYRLEIWQTTIAEIARRPLFGHGISATLAINGDFGQHPHDLYLSALFYSGAVGLLLLLGGLCWIVHDVLRTPPSVERRICLALLLHLVVSGATDLSQIIKGPGELWYIVWFPLAYTLGYLRDTATPGGVPRSRLDDPDRGATSPPPAGAARVSARTHAPR